MIELCNVAAGYGGRRILDISSLAIEEGRISAVAGANGSGKSTLLKAVVGLIPHTGGILLDGGTDIAALPQTVRARHIAYLPQHYPIPNMTVQMLAAHGRFPRMGFSKLLSKRDRELVERAMRLTDVWEWRHKSLRELSGGIRQRAFLAMVVAQDTDIILLDEPGTYLDIRHQLETFALLKRLAAEGKGILLSSHDLPQCFSFSDSISLLKDGAIIATGAPAAIAAEGALLSRAMGVSLSPAAAPDALYAYQLTRGDAATAGTSGAMSPC